MFSRPHLISNWSGLVSKLTDFLSSPSYIIIQRPLLLVGVTIAPIQPIHGQGYNSDIPRPDAPVIYIGAFPILTARPGRRSIYSILHWRQISFPGAFFWDLRTARSHLGPDLENWVDAEAIRNAIHVVLLSLRSTCDTMHCLGERALLSSSFIALFLFAISSFKFTNNAI